MRYLLVIFIGLLVSAAAADINRFTINLGSFDTAVVDSINVYLWFGVDLPETQDARFVRTLNPVAGDGGGMAVRYPVFNREIEVPFGARFVGIQAIGYQGGLPTVASAFTVRLIDDFQRNGYGVMPLDFSRSLFDALRQTEVLRQNGEFSTRFEDNSAMISNTINQFFELGLISDERDYEIINGFLKQSNSSILRLSESERNQLFGMLIGTFNERIRRTEDASLDAFLEFFVRFANDMLSVDARIIDSSVSWRPKKDLLQAMIAAYVHSPLPLLPQAQISLRMLSRSGSYADCVDLAASLMLELDRADVNDVFVNSIEKLEQLAAVMRTGQECVRLQVATLHAGELAEIVRAQQIDKLGIYYADSQNFGHFNRAFMSLFLKFKDKFLPNPRIAVSEILDYSKIIEATSLSN